MDSQPTASSTPLNVFSSSALGHLTSTSGNLNTSTSPHPRYAVGKRAHKCFKALFYDPSENDACGEVAWTDVLAAMAAVDFEVEAMRISVAVLTQES